MYGIWITRILADITLVRLIFETINVGTIPMDEPTVSDMSITDEHVIIPLKSTFQDVAARLVEAPSAAVLIHDAQVGRIVGVITSRDLFAVCAEGRPAHKEKVAKRMCTNLMELGTRTSLTEALERMRVERPAAVLVMGDEGQFAGYFSPEDYREAVRKLDTHKQLISRMERSKEGLQAAKEGMVEEENEDDIASSLLDIMLGEFEEDDEEEVGSMSL